SYQPSRCAAEPNRSTLCVDTDAIGGGTMPEGGFAEQIATLNATLQAIEGRVASGEVTGDALTEFKSSVDDMRLRLWGLLRAGSAHDYRAFQEPLRLRRAKEICRGLERDLRNGGMSS